MITIKMILNAKGAANSRGNVTQDYKADQVYTMKEDWQVSIAEVFIEEELAIEVKVAEEPVKKKVAKKKVAKKKAD